ncbi:carbonic anhydrase [Phanerochaete sordida]|uniref:Carbonic anhydrase n=1 Tax=Phanerochaete sordida TaxID=48140 RepID=A0A9P3LG62_9APHY|nr:carbonic anhydrase [Phanerochaete sordida]
MRENHPEIFPIPPEQRPRVFWIGCADSRVPESVILNQLPGQIFTHRNIANQVQLTDASIVSAIHFAVRTLGVQHIIVAGHTACGGVGVCMPRDTPDKAECRDGQPFDAEKVRNDPWVTIQHWPPPSPLNTWLQPLRDLAETMDPPPASVNELAEANVRQQVLLVREVLKAGGGSFKVEVHGWIYDVKNGHVEDIGCSVVV